MTRPGLEPGPLDPESSALTTRPPCLPVRDLTLVNVYFQRPFHMKISLHVPKFIRCFHDVYPEKGRGQNSTSGILINATLNLLLTSQTNLFSNLRQVLPCLQALRRKHHLSVNQSFLHFFYYPSSRPLQRWTKTTLPNTRVAAKNTLYLCLWQGVAEPSHMPQKQPLQHYSRHLQLVLQWHPKQLSMSSVHLYQRLHVQE